MLIHTIPASNPSNPPHISTSHGRSAYLSHTRHTETRGIAILHVTSTSHECPNSRGLISRNAPSWPSQGLIRQCRCAWESYAVGGHFTPLDYARFMLMLCRVPPQGPAPPSRSGCARRVRATGNRLCVSSEATSQRKPWRARQPYEGCPCTDTSLLLPRYSHTHFMESMCSPLPHSGPRTGTAHRFTIHEAGERRAYQWRFHLRWPWFTDPFWDTVL